MVQEPAISSGTPGAKNPYTGRWRWWYSAIADWMIRNPGGKIEDCAKELNRHANTISLIINTDIFREYLAQRKANWAADHDLALRSRLIDTATKSMDLILDTMKAKGDQIPLQRLESLATGALDRLGYAPKAQPSVVVNNNVDNSKTQTLNVSVSDLEQARLALRQAEASKAGSSLAPLAPFLPTAGASDVEAEPPLDGLAELSEGMPGEVEK